MSPASWEPQGELRKSCSVLLIPFQESCCPTGAGSRRVQVYGAPPQPRLVLVDSGQPWAPGNPGRSSFWVWVASGMALMSRASVVVTKPISPLELLPLEGPGPASDQQPGALPLGWHIISKQGPSEAWMLQGRSGSGRRGRNRTNGNLTRAVISFIISAWVSLSLSLFFIKMQMEVLWPEVPLLWGLVPRVGGGEGFQPRFWGSRGYRILGEGEGCWSLAKSPFHCRVFHSSEKCYQSWR